MVVIVQKCSEMFAGRVGGRIASFSKSGFRFVKSGWKGKKKRRGEASRSYIGGNGGGLMILLTAGV